MATELDELYLDIILEHYRYPRNRARVEAPHIVAEGANVLCGDEISLQVRLSANGTVEAVGIQGKGCSVNVAASSMFTVYVTGKTLEEVEVAKAAIYRMLNGDEVDGADVELLGELGVLLGVRKFPTRITCALMPWKTLEDGLEQYRSQAR